MIPLSRNRLLTDRFIRMFALFVAIQTAVSVVKADECHHESDFDYCDAFESSSILLDTFPLNNVPYDTYEYNPFDVLPEVVEDKVEYDPTTGNYIIYKKIGEEYFSAPTYMTFSEYAEYRNKKLQDLQFSKRNGAKIFDGQSIGGGDPIEKLGLDKKLQDRLFGSTEIDIRPVGNVDLSLGAAYTSLSGPGASTIPAAGQKNVNILFDPNINIGVTGKVGDKMDLDFNYNTQATFDFENQIKLQYTNEDAGEDDILRAIEAGNVSLPLKSSLIQGAESLFGLKTELQFGKLYLTGLVSQQRSEQKSIEITNGATIQEFELRTREYDENRHFFLGHYFRDRFEANLQNLPQVGSRVRITNVEVWVSLLQSDTRERAQTIVGVTDLGEGQSENITSSSDAFNTDNVPTSLIKTENGELYVIPSNNTTPFFADVLADDAVRQSDGTNRILEGPMYGLESGRDFDKTDMRRLSTNEYTVNEQLGYISLNIRLRPNQALGVAYEYTYLGDGDQVYRVGEISNSVERSNTFDSLTFEPDNVVFVKLLKPQIQTPEYNQATGQAESKIWDLMMKNIYSLPTGQLTNEDFQFDIFYEDPTESTTFKRFIPDDDSYTPLLQLFQLDRLSRSLDPQPDGVFDYLAGITVIPQTASIVFPVLEPFGRSLTEQDPDLYGPYAFNSLYENTVTAAQDSLFQDRFVMRGQVKSNISDEINLNAFNIPRGSVVVTAGAQRLTEGIDYEIDYGLGRIKVLNSSLLQSGVPLNVSFEDQSLFSLQQKTMFGLRADYRANKNLTIGGTYMHLFERPFTQKVNAGDDPINNRIYGFDINYTKESQGITNFIDKLPFHSTNAPSSVNFSAEVATLKPGQSKAIRGNCAYEKFYTALDPNYECPKESVVSIDDFEGASTSMNLQNPQEWKLASVPKNAELWPEAEEPNPTVAGHNRALFNWYRIENQLGRGSLLSVEDVNDPYTRPIFINDLFPDRQFDNLQANFIYTFDMSYYPNERGPYNYERIEPTFSDISGQQLSAGIDTENRLEDNLALNDPESRWGGVMTYLPNNDFEAANFQYIEFWMLNPFMDKRDGSSSGDAGELIFHLGNVSEDILADDLQFFENGIPGPNDVQAVKNTAWARVPISSPQAVSFDNNLVDVQDLGLDGLDDMDERSFFEDYVQDIEQVFGGQSAVSIDPANDNFVNYLDETAYAGETNILNKFKKFNGFQGNVPEPGQQFVTGVNEPDTEDLNGNRGLDQAESYYQYRIPLEGDQDGFDLENNPNLAQFITDVREVEIENRPVEKWYRFRIPIQEPFRTTDAQQFEEIYSTVGNISGFRSIQFMRMIARGFERPVTMRLAEFSIARNQWRPLDESCFAGVDGGKQTFGIQLDQVSFEENRGKEPFAYVSPDGIQRENVAGAFGNILQNEAALKLNSCLPNDSTRCAASPQVFRLTNLDLRFFKKLQMYVHAERDIDEVMQDTIPDDAVSLFVRFGKDFTDNYYEYEVPLKFSENVTGESEQKFIVWPFDNFVNFELSEFTDLKLARNLDGGDISEIFETVAANNPEHKLKIKGTPTLGYLKGISIGLRNNSKVDQCVEVWVNELRLAGLDNEGGSAGLARLQVDMADFGDVTLAGQFSTVGWGALNQRVFDRSLESTASFDLSTNMNLDMLLPKNLNLSIPFYAQYSKEKIKHKFDQYELDLTVDEVKSYTPDPIESQEVEDRSSAQTTIKSYNFTNVRKLPNQNKKGGPKPWDLSNIGVSYSHTVTEYKDDIYREDRTVDEKSSLDYRYSTKPLYVEPLKFIKSDALRFLSAFNFNPIPSTFSFSTQIARLKNQKQYRLPDDIAYVFNDQKWDWDRRYNLNWDLARNLKLNFTANNYSVIDELKQVGVARTPEERQYVDVYGREIDPETGSSYYDLVQEDSGYLGSYSWDNIKKGGRNKNYNHSINAGYTLPFKTIGVLDWVSSQASYRAGYQWNAASLNIADLGNVIQNDRSLGLNTTFSFDRLYDKIPYLKALNGSNSRSNDENQISTLEKIFVRPLLAIQSVRVDITGDENTIIPGFTPVPKLLGLSGGFDAPGFGFVLGGQPDLKTENSNWVNQNAELWLTQAEDQFQPVIQNQDKRLIADISLEPWRYLQIDVNFNKNVSDNFTQNIIYKDGNYVQQGLYEVGSITQSYFSLPTLFSDVEEVFNEFSDSRKVVSNYLGDQINADIDPDTGYSVGYGRDHIDVVLNAFLNTYEGKDLLTATDAQKASYIDNYFDDLKSTSSLPAPNWNLRYNGLSNIEAFKNVFKSFSITHGYSSDLTINEFKSDLQYNPGEFFIDPERENQNYVAEYNIPQVAISERFDPIIGIDFRTIGDITFQLSYNKQRNLTLETQSLNQLAERKNTAFTVGFGFVRQGVNLFGGGRRSGRTEAPQESNQVVTSREKELTVNLDIQFRDDVTLNHLLDNQRPAEKTRGSKTLSINPEVGYVLNQYLELSAFLNYNTTKQKLTDAPNNLRIDGGVRFSFNLQ